MARVVLSNIMTSVILEMKNIKNGVLSDIGGETRKRWGTILPFTNVCTDPLVLTGNIWVKKSTVPPSPLESESSSAIVFRGKTRENSGVLICLSNH